MNEEVKERKLKSVKTYTIILTEYEDGPATLNRRTDGFNAYELLGVLTQAQHQVIAQIEGWMTPSTNIKRENIIP